MQAGRGKRAGTRRQVRPCRQAGAGRRRQAQAGAGRHKQAQAGAGRRTNRPTGRRAGEQVRRSGSPRRARARARVARAPLLSPPLREESIFSRGVTQTLKQRKA